MCPLGDHCFRAVESVMIFTPSIFGKQDSEELFFRRAAINSYHSNLRGYHVKPCQYSEVAKNINNHSW